MTQTTLLDFASISSLDNLTLGEQKSVSIVSSQASSFMLAAKQWIIMELSDLPNEIICLIIKFLSERSRRQFKQTSKRMLSCYCAYVHISRKNPPKNLKECQGVHPCNLYNGRVLHKCTCRPLVGWERY